MKIMIKRNEITPLTEQTAYLLRICEEMGVVDFNAYITQDFHLTKTRQLLHGEHYEKTPLS